MNSWLPGLSSRRYRFLYRYFQENPLEWGSNAYYPEVLQKAKDIRGTFWLSILLSWSPFGLLFAFYVFVENRNFRSRCNLYGVPNLNTLYKEIKKQSRPISYSSELAPISASNASI